MQLNDVFEKPSKKEFFNFCFFNFLNIYVKKINKTSIYNFPKNCIFMKRMIIFPYLICSISCLSLKEETCFNIASEVKLNKQMIEDKFVGIGPICRKKLDRIQNY